MALNLLFLESHLCISFPINSHFINCNILYREKELMPNDWGILIGNCFYGMYVKKNVQNYKHKCWTVYETLTQHGFMPNSMNLCHFGVN